jgi:hypothetical protein
MNVNLPTMALRAVADELEGLTAQIRRGGLPDALRFWKLTGEEYDQFDKERKRIYEALESLSRKTIPEMMEEQGIKTIMPTRR